MLAALSEAVYVDDTYGAIPSVATADGRERIPTETFSEIITDSLVRLSSPELNGI